MVPHDHGWAARSWRLLPRYPHVQRACSLIECGVRARFSGAPLRLSWSPRRMNGCGPCLGIGTRSNLTSRSWQIRIKALLLVPLVFATEARDTYSRLNAITEATDIRNPVGVTDPIKWPRCTSPGIASEEHDSSRAVWSAVLVFPPTVIRAWARTC
jgi:hypothetical protein